MQVSVGTMTFSELLYYLLFYFNHTFRSTLVVLFYHKKMVTPTKIHDKSQKMQRAQCLAMCFVHFGLQMKLCSTNTRGRSCCLLIGRKLLCRLQCPHKVFLFRASCNLNEVLDLISGGSRISRRWRRQLPGGGAPTNEFAKSSQRLHEIERNWTRGRPSP